MARHFSPPGTYERIRKDLLEDPTLTDSEARLIMYLITLPPGWEISPGHLAAALGRSPNWVRHALRALRRRGLIYDEERDATRDKDSGRFGPRVTRFRRELITAPTWDDAETPQVGPRGGIPSPGRDLRKQASSQVTPGDGIPPPGATSQDSMFPQVAPRVGISSPYRDNPKRELNTTGYGSHTREPSATADNGSAARDRAALSFLAAKIHARHVQACKPSMTRDQTRQIGDYVDELITHGKREPEHVEEALSRWRDLRARGQSPSRRTLDSLLERVELAAARARASSGTDEDGSTVLVSVECERCRQFHPLDWPCPVTT